MIKPHTFHPTILREYDIRGRVGETLSDTDAYALGLAFGTYLKREHNGQPVALGYDGRDSSPQFAEQLQKGLNETGCDVTLIGRGPTPMLYFAVKHLKTDAGIMVTGSHNPSAYNGFKMSLYNQSIYGEAIQNIGRIAASGDFETGAGASKTVNIQTDYIARLVQDLDIDRPLKVAWDNGNGAAGEILAGLIKKLPGEHIVLYGDIDGTFPNHHPDPTVDKNMEDLIKTVRDEKCDLGIAFDGDGDRIGVVDENGTILRCDHLLSLYAAEVLQNNPGATIIGDVKCSDSMFKEIERLGGQPVMSQTGHSLVKTKMKETGAPLAGELSGHIFFADKYYGYDDALYCAVRLLNIVSKAESLSALTAHFPDSFSTPDIRVDVPEEDKFQIIDDLKAHLKSENMMFDNIDGVRVSNDQGWWIVRASNTQNAISIRAEAYSQEGLESLKIQIQKLFGAAYQNILIFS